MPSLVAQLQEAALDRNVPVEDLLRRAKVVASKLDLHQFLSWIDREMKGYGRDDQVPEYRQLSGTVNAFNPYHGWREPIWAQDKASQELRRTMSNYKARLPVGEISDLINRHEKNSSSSTFAVPYGSIKVQGAFGEELANAQLEIDRARLAGILDAVRNTILEWALELEKSGIVGEAFTFSQPEKQRAHEPGIIVSINNVENFSGVAGAVSGQSAVHAQANLRVETLDLEAIRAFLREFEKSLDSLEFSSSVKQTLEEQIHLTAAEMESKAPDESRLRSLLGSIKRIVEGAIAGAGGSFAVRGVLLALDHLFK
ncbi:MAG: hypothetical protein WB580_09420 [Candidatus Binataceae bacterium]